MSQSRTRPIKFREAYPRQLLDDYAEIARRKGPEAIENTAVRMRSFDIRRVLARAVGGGVTSLEDILEIARLPAGDELRKSLGRADVSALSRLSRVVFKQDLLREDRADALAIADLIYEVAGHEAVPSRQQNFHTQLAVASGQIEQASRLLDEYEGLSERVRTAVHLDLENSFSPVNEENGLGDTDRWLEIMGQQVLGVDLRLAGNGPTPFDRLVGIPDHLVDGGPLITVIVTSYRPDHSLLTAVRSLARQSWTALEILVVDDGSPGSFVSVLNEAAAVDDRVRIIRVPKNRGTYHARNVGLDAARGEYVTFLDSDDWSSPHRIEDQIGALLDEPAMFVVQTDMYNLTEKLIVTRPGLSPVMPHAASIMFKLGPVLERIGYFDSVRKAADNEYLNRIRVAFGEDAVVRYSNQVHILRRLRSDSLSNSELRGNWAHPARLAYWSAYEKWHDKIRVHGADPYLPADSASRPFAAPARFIHPEAGVMSPKRYDVVFASVWTRFGGPQKSMIEEIKALHGAGRTVGVLDMGALRFMSKDHRPLCEAIQELVELGKVDLLLGTEGHETKLLVLRYPPILQFAPHGLSEIAAEKVIILANQPPAERDGSDLRYVPHRCSEVAHELFGREPLWIPQGPQVREALIEAGLDGSALTDFNIPGIVDPAEWPPERAGFRSKIPVVGRHARDDVTKWPADPETLLGVFPESPALDVRLMGGIKYARRVLGRPVPRNWLAYGYDEIEVNAFLNQLDFWIYFPHPARCEAFGRAILEALASGCVVILPDRFRTTFGDAAVYRDPVDVQEAVASYFGDVNAFMEQSRLARCRVREHFSHETYLKTILPLIGQEAVGCL